MKEGLNIRALAEVDGLSAEIMDIVSRIACAQKRFKRGRFHLLMETDTVIDQNINISLRVLFSETIDFARTDCSTAIHNLGNDLALFHFSSFREKGSSSNYTRSPAQPSEVVQDPNSQPQTTPITIGRKHSSPNEEQRQGESRENCYFFTAIIPPWFPGGSAPGNQSILHVSEKHFTQFIAFNKLDNAGKNALIGLYELFFDKAAAYMKRFKSCKKKSTYIVMTPPWMPKQICVGGSGGRTETFNNCKLPRTRELRNSRGPYKAAMILAAFYEKEEDLCKDALNGLRQEILKALGKVPLPNSSLEPQEAETAMRGERTNGMDDLDRMDTVDRMELSSSTSHEHSHSLPLEPHEIAGNCRETGRYQADGLPEDVRPNNQAPINSAVQERGFSATQRDTSLPIVARNEGQGAGRTKSVPVASLLAAVSTEVPGSPLSRLREANTYEGRMKEYLMRKANGSVFLTAADVPVLHECEQDLAPTNDVVHEQQQSHAPNQSGNINSNSEENIEGVPALRRSHDDGEERVPGTAEVLSSDEVEERPADPPSKVITNDNLSDESSVDSVEMREHLASMGFKCASAPQCVMQSQDEQFITTECHRCNHKMHYECTWKGNVEYWPENDRRGSSYRGNGYSSNEDCVPMPMDVRKYKFCKNCAVLKMRWHRRGLKPDWKRKFRNGVTRKKIAALTGKRKPLVNRNEDIGPDQAAKALVRVQSPIQEPHGPDEEQENRPAQRRRKHSTSPV